MKITRKSYILAAVLFLTLIFSMAAVCNSCSIGPIEEEDDTGQVDEVITSDEEEQAQGTEDAEPEPPNEEEEAEEETAQEPDETVVNSQPYIYSVALNGDVIDTTQEVRVLQGDSLDFIVQAGDDDGDELTFGAYDSVGNIQDVTKIDDNTAGFSWTAPDEPGVYQVTIDVFDESGGETSVIINVTVNEYVGPTETISLYPSPTLCGFTDGDYLKTADEGWAFFGDSPRDTQLKGYISFDIRGISGLDPDSIRTVFCTVEHTVINEYDFAEYIHIKAFDYGESLDVGDFRVGGTFIASYPTNELSYMISNEALFNTLAEALDEGRQYYQLKFGMDSVTNGDGVSDGLRIDLDSIVLSVVYAE